MGASRTVLSLGRDHFELLTAEPLPDGPSPFLATFEGEVSAHAAPSRELVGPRIEPGARRRVGALNLIDSTHSPAGRTDHDAASPGEPRHEPSDLRAVELEIRRQLFVRAQRDEHDVGAMASEQLTEPRGAQPKVRARTHPGARCVAASLSLDAGAEAMDETRIDLRVSEVKDRESRPDDERNNRRNQDNRNNIG